MCRISVVVASKNPVKARAARDGFVRTFADAVSRFISSARAYGVIVKSTSASVRVRKADALPEVDTSMTYAVIGDTGTLFDETGKCRLKWW